MTDTLFLGFQDGKDPKALRTIGEVAKAFNLRQHVLRYWEDQFPMLQPLTRAGGRRYYRPEDVALIAEICRLLHVEGFTIRGARQALADWGRGGGSASGKNSRETSRSESVPAPAVTPLEAGFSRADEAQVMSHPQMQIDSALEERLLALRKQLAEALDRA